MSIVETVLTRLATCISSKRFWLLLLDDPSVPIHNFTPAALIFPSGAIPLASLQLLVGFVATAASSWESRDISPSVRCTQWASRCFVFAKYPMESKYSSGGTPCAFMQSSTSPFVSDRCVCRRASCSFAQSWAYR